MQMVNTEAPPLGERVGSFRFLLADQRWEWSDEVARIHGYEPGSVVPTTELLLAHKHPDDKPGVTALIKRVIRDGHPFSSRHRIIDAHGRIRVVVVAGDRMFDDAGKVLGTEGFYVDVTDAYESDVRDTLNRVVGNLAGRRAVTEQAKGILMFVYGIPGETAFELLRWRSQETNVKLRDLCVAFVRMATNEPVSPDLLRHEVDHMLMTAHTNVHPK
jgi:PAS domain S-box-containing protein